MWGRATGKNSSPLEESTRQLYLQGQGGKHLGVRRSGLVVAGGWTEDVGGREEEGGRGWHDVLESFILTPHFSSRIKRKVDIGLTYLEGN